MLKYIGLRKQNEFWRKNLRSGLKGLDELEKHNVRKGLIGWNTFDG